MKNKTIYEIVFLLYIIYYKINTYIKLKEVYIINIKPKNNMHH